MIQTIITGLMAGGLYAVVALGMNLILGVIGFVNFAHGEVLMIGSYVTFWLFSLFQINPLLTIPISFLSGAMIGVAAYFFLFRPLIGLPEIRMKTYIETYGLSLMLPNIVRIIWTAEYRGVNPPYGGIVIGSVVLSATRFASFCISIFIAIILYFILRRTFIGKAIRAVADNLDAAKLYGINPGRIYLLVLALGYGLAGLGGAMLAPIYAIYPWMGGAFNLLCVAIVILGGAGNFAGTIAGGLTVGLIESFVQDYIGIAWMSFVIFLVIWLILLLRPLIGGFKKW